MYLWYGRCLCSVAVDTESLFGQVFPFPLCHYTWTFLRSFPLCAIIVLDDHRKLKTRNLGDIFNEISVTWKCLLADKALGSYTHTHTPQLILGQPGSTRGVIRRHLPGMLLLSLLPSCIRVNSARDFQAAWEKFRNYCRSMQRLNFFHVVSQG